jgi:ribosomal protein S18 acetylase RimI-like enzyme
MKNKRYWELNDKELGEFFKPLKKEKDTFRLSLEELSHSEIIVVVRVGKEISGIAGIRKRKMVPVMFIAVKSKYHRKGVGKKLMNKLQEVARLRYSFMVLSVMKKNEPAIKLFREFEFEIFKKKSEVYYMIYSFNQKGKFFSKILIKLSPIFWIF